jgi:hypothetical protein
MMAQLDGSNKGTLNTPENTLKIDPYVMRCWGYFVQLLGPRLFESDMINSMLKIPEVCVKFCKKIMRIANFYASCSSDEIDHLP